MSRSDPYPQQPYGREFIDLAERGINTRRSYLAALLRIIFYPLGFAVLVGLAAILPAIFGWQLPALVVETVAIIGQFGSVIVAGVVVIRSVQRCHRRPWLTLITPEPAIDWRRVAVGIVAEAAIVLAQLALVHLVTGWPWRLALPAALPIVLLTLMLIPLQAASEEILFRGYLTQALGRLIRSRIAIALIIAAIFGALHLNVYGPLTMAYFFALSLVFSLVSLRDGRLELVIGGHAAINFLAVAMAGFSPLAPPAVILGQIGIGQSALPFNWAAIAVVIVHGALFYGLTRLGVRLFCRPRFSPSR